MRTEIIGTEVATAKRAIEHGALVIASPWNPPSHMVETFNRNGTTAKRLRYNQYAAYAQHLNDFVTYMKNNGVNLMRYQYKTSLIMHMNGHGGLLRKSCVS